MRCPRCGAPSKVYKTKQSKKGASVVRWRICRNTKCAARFTTQEQRLKAVKGSTYSQKGIHMEFMR